LIKSKDKMYLINRICHFEGEEKNGLDRIIVSYVFDAFERNKGECYEPLGTKDQLAPIC